MKIHLLTGYEVQVTAPCAAPKAINLDVCILCQKRILSSGETGSCIVSLAKQMESCDIRASRVCQVTVLEQGIIKYHALSCYRSFQRDMANPVSILTQPEQCELTPFQVMVAHDQATYTQSDAIKRANYCSLST